MGLVFKSRNLIWIMIGIALLSMSSPPYSCFADETDRRYDPESLTAFFRDRAGASVPNPVTGVLYNVSLPSNFTGMAVTFVRLRRGSFRKRGANFSSVHFPADVVPDPLVTRIAVVYENLGNWSSAYYSMPNHSLVTPVIGFSVYDSSSVLGGERINLSVRGKPISILFDKVGPLPVNGAVPKCVRFDDNGGFEITDVSFEYGCSTRSQGHFSIVVSHSGAVGAKRKRYWNWWLIGFGGAFVAIVTLVLATTVIFKTVKRKRLNKMEKESENGVSFDIFWVRGTTKMPSASMLRTPPRIEDSYVI